MSGQMPLQSDFVVGILSGTITLASISLAIFGFIFSTFAQLMREVGVEKPPSTAFRLKELAVWALVLTVTSSLISILCVLWFYVPSDNLLYFISLSTIILLISLCSIIGYVITKMMRLK